MGQVQVVPSNISKMQNRVFGALTFRDIGFLMGALALASITFKVLPGGPFIQGLAAAIVAGLSLGVGFIHLVVDIEPMEKFIFTWYSYKQTPKEMVWKKEVISEQGFYASDSTQSFFPFHITKSGVLVYHDNGGGAILLKVEGVDYQLLSEGEKDVIIATFGNFLDNVTFPVQILIKTTPLDLRSFIHSGEESIQRNRQYNNLYQASQDYVDFLERYQQSDMIYNKAMYIVLPYTPDAEDAGNRSLGVAGMASMDNAKSNNPINNLFKSKKNEDLDLSSLQTKEFSEDFTVKLLNDRQQIVKQFLSGVQGINCHTATLPEYVELFYYFFNINESNIKAILSREPTDNLASNSPEYSAIKERAARHKEQQTQQSIYNLDDILNGK